MSSVEAERKRRVALLALREKKLGTSLPFSSRTLSSPDAASVLVPSSSTSFPPRFPNGAQHGSPQTGPSYSSGPSLIRSSNIWGLHANGSSSSSGFPGSPLAVVSAIHNRRAAEDLPRKAGESSLSYEPSLSDLSPSSPQPLSRLKARYTDTTPTKPSLGESSRIPVSRSPSLVAAAQQQINADEEKLIGRLAIQFSRVKRSIIASCVRRHAGDPDRAINEVQYINEQGRSVSPESDYVSSPARPAVPASRPAIPRPPVPVVTQPPPPAPRPIPKPKKNEKSAIYANRGSSGKRRDPDDSELEADGSGGESEMDWSGDDGPKRKRRKGIEQEMDAEGVALKAFNENAVEELTGTIACRVEQAAKIISLRPYEDVEAVRIKLTKARGVSNKLFEQYTEIMEGFVQIDSCLNRCAAIAEDVSSTLMVWRGASKANDSVIGTPRSDGLNDVKVDVAKVSELLRMETDMRKKKILGSYIQTQPPTLGEGTVLKDYQLLGVNWLNLLYSKKIGCILADEMGLGKTIQVIAFLANLKERKINGPHMIFVPASTLENWTREFDRFAPEIDVQTYYGSQAERAALRDDLKRRFRSGRLEVVLASYTQVASPDDLGFFRKKIDFETCTYDEGHRLKNCMTKAYTDLLSIKPRWRLLLTGTPLQNNLQELVSLLMFIHKDIFTDAEQYLRAIFKSQGQANLLSQQRVSRARTMLTPFVLRRRKAQVLELPPKVERVEHCEMTKSQASLYRETLQRSKKVLEEWSDEALDREDEEKVTKLPTTDGKAKARKGKPEERKGPFASSSSHILMDLRKAASHPLLFRRLYSKAKVRQIAKECLNTPTWCDANLDYVIEDLEIMSDAEIHNFCKTSDYNELRKFALKPQVFLEGGKVAALHRHIERCQAEGKRMLLFSQFVMILDILQVALDHLGVRYTRLDGGTRTDERQGLVDEFNDDPDITVFLLSTKAGGVGINLTAASVVVIYDQDFNPHNDRQAADRAYRIGQEKEVEVIKLITKDTIDEDMLNIGLTKLQLDDAVGGEEITLDGEASNGKDDQTAKEVRKSLLTTLRNKFEAGDGIAEINCVEETAVIKEDQETTTPTKKKARASMTASQIKEEDAKELADGKVEV